ncbi:sorting and assembly machinery component 50 homolog isoform X1 [Penaeus vannamei]|uniref:sorting and assembly machinery component 50 homolog isoform X1 n=1 Tax=Penaeus vannamei TaxID=6689 RepID=UPI000F67E431|nr:sorting and assembly machinery component 50 homolog isoform X1 [Penaeus vannamei]
MGTVHAKSPEQEEHDGHKVDFQAMRHISKEEREELRKRLKSIRERLAEQKAQVMNKKLRNTQAHVQRVHVDGLARTKDDIVINTVRDVFTAQDFYSVILKIHEARSRLAKLGCFKDVGVFIDTYEGPDARDDGIEVTFEVREVNFLGAKVNTSVGNNEGTVTTGGMLKNIFGRAEELSLEYSHGTKRSSSFYSTFVKPFHNEASTVLTASLYQQGSEAPWSGYRELDRGALLNLAFNSAPNVQQKLILEGCWRHLSCLSRSTAFAVREQAGHSLKSSLRHELNVDKRDDLVFPTDGVTFTLKNELAGLGGDIGFLKNELDMQVNVPVTKELVIQGSLQAGHLLPLRNNKTHCITDRFMLGGPMNLRGFEMAGVGPHSDGCSLGAEMFWAAALHAYIPLPLLSRGGSISEKFRLHGFVNTGNIGDFVMTDDYKENLQTLIRDMRLSYGAGLAMSLGGFARVELNYCIPLLLQRGDRPNQGLQFGVAATFL